MRDRDDVGRARNSRARDAYGRPLARGEQGEPTVPDAAAERLAADPVAALAEARRLLAADRPFHAHEVLEAVWKAEPTQQRELWRALAQLAVGLTHVRRGNPAGAATLIGRATAALEDYAARPPYGLDLTTLIGQARALDPTDPKATFPSL